MSGLRVGAGLTLGAVCYLGTQMVDRGITHAWSPWARGLWAIGLIALTIAAVLVTLNGLGLVSTEILDRSYTGATPPARRITLAHFLGVYLGLLVGGIGLALVLEKRYGVSGIRTIFVFVGGAFAWAATRRPWWLFDSVRRIGWFAAITNDRAMQVTLMVLALLLIGSGLLAPSL